MFCDHRWERRTPLNNLIYGSGIDKQPTETMFDII